MTIKLNKELCYKTMVNKRNTPHTTAIMLLEDIVDAHGLQLKSDPTDSKDKTLSTHLIEGYKVDYKYFKEKYNFEHAKVRYALAILEKYNLITRRRHLPGNIPSVKKGGSESYIRLQLNNLKKFLKL